MRKFIPLHAVIDIGSYDQEMSLTSDQESDEAILPRNSIDSPLADDDNNYGNIGSNSPLKKGPWTSTEDDILLKYVQKHGEGNWNAVQKHTSLSRCGKSCRLRWANHLRPDLKKGPFSDEEERQIIELHAKYGNKWARMAAELPGRTDNEIKNFWNTRIKRRQKAGLPVYPDDVCPRLQNENQHDDEIDSSYLTEEVHPADFVPVEDFEIPPIEFKSPNQPINRVDVNTINIPGLSASVLHVKNLVPCYNYRSMCPVLHSPKPPSGSELLFNGYNTPIASSFTGVNHLSGDGSLQIAQPVGFSPFYEHNSVPDQAVSSDLFPGNHTILSGTSELPSLQNQRDGWGEPSPTFPMPAFDDILIQNHQAENPCMFSAPNSGLLDDVLYESETKKFNTNASLFPQTSDIPTMAAHIVNDSTQDTQENLWGYDGQFSPVGNSSAPAFWDGSSFSVNSFEEPQSENEFPGGSSELIFPNCLKEKRDPGANANLKMARSTW